VVLVKGADDFISKNRSLLEKYFENPCPTGVLVMTVGSWDARTRLARMLPSVGRMISVTEPKRWELPGRLVRYAADAYGKSLTKEAAELLVELSGDNLGQLYTEIDKLAVFANAEKTISHNHVESLIGHNRLFGAFDVIDAVVAGDKGRAVNRLRAMFAGDKSAEYMVVGAFAYHFRRMFNAKVLLENNVQQNEIANRLNIRSNRDGFFSQLRKVTLKQLGSGLKRLAAIDYAIKTGRARAAVGMEQFVLKLAGGLS
jgi:DNA polymerase-3 subunit delta